MYISGLIGGLGVALAGGNQEQISVGNWAASNAAANNAVAHATKGLMEQARSCSANPTEACRAQIQEQAQEADARFQKRFEAACSGANASFASCNVAMSGAASGLNDLELMRDLYGKDDPQARAMYQGLVDQQRDDMARMQPLLETLQAGETPFGAIFEQLAPNVSPADGAHAVGGVAAGIFGSMRPLGLGSTGRVTPANLTEQLAMEQAMANPAVGRPLRVPMMDPRWPAKDGWVKMTQNINGVEIHYVRNSISGSVDDFKFK